MMATERRTLLLGLGSTLAAGLGPQACTSAPSRVAGQRDVVAAGQPAALLIWALARDRLAAWPRRPDAQSLTALPPEAATLPDIGALADGDPRAAIEAVAALQPRLVLQYGNTDPANQVRTARTKARLGVDWHLIDGELAAMPEALRQAGRVLDAGIRAGELADTAASVIDRWRAAPAGRSFYYARGADGLETSLRGASATEVLEGANWTNVAVNPANSGRVAQEQIVAWDPETIVTLDPAFARFATQDPVWRWRRNRTRRSVLLLPTTPFGWIDRPPSVNRLLGCAWLADPEVRWLGLTMLSRRLYGLAPAEVKRPQWLA